MEETSGKPYISVLERQTQNNETYRPYSRAELKDRRDTMLQRQRLSDALAHHPECGHSYYTKLGGRKEELLRETGESGNCSVCWKWRKTPQHLKKAAEELVEKFGNINRLSLDSIETERNFYIWLYREYN